MKQEKGFIHILLILVVIAVVAVFVLGKDKLNSVIQIGTPVPSATVDPTADWKTYTAKVGYSFKYPNDWSENYEGVGKNLYDTRTNPSQEGGVRCKSQVDCVSVSVGESPPTNSQTILDVSKAHYDPANFTQIKIGNSTTGEIDGIKVTSVDKKLHPLDGPVGEMVSVVVKTPIGKVLVIQLASPTVDNYKIIFDQILSTFKFSDIVATSNESQTVVNGASLENIKYTLPNGLWTAKLRTIEVDRAGPDLFIAPTDGGGGYLGITVYNYDSSLGRREFYCQKASVEEWGGRSVCIDSTYFTEAKIGNISGYMTHSIDNSGGGAEYFGSKGNKFYIVATYSGGSSSNEYLNSHQKVLDSLIF